jgi:hypothetical protein
MANLRARLGMEGWEVPDRVLEVLAGVLPAEEGVLEASVVTDTEAAFILRDTLLVAAWEEGDEFLTTDVLTLSANPLTVVWNADWLARHDSDDSVDVPEVRPMMVTMRGDRGEVYVLPFDAAWSNPVGCVNFASTLIEKAHGFRPAVGSTRPANAVRNWKR